eukprot:GEMP01023217.1.p1 GENE.GEMP01023217.1~~GEMP01023217.1.p1  ORF type:complete len:351 (+),score=88.48 GEMP01023217.1:31-1083(+)
MTEYDVYVQKKRGVTRAGPYDRPRAQGRSNNTEAGETGLCATHNKQRCMDCLEFNTDTGLYSCTPDRRCKGTGPARAPMVSQTRNTNVRDQMCMVHHKKRAERVLYDDGTGLVQCLPDQKCKGQGGEEEAPVAARMAREPKGRGSKASGMCMVHSKLRLLEVLIEDGAGFVECAPEHECKGTQKQEERAPPQGRPASGMCILHNKNRLLEVLVDDGQGFLECAPEHRCKGVPSDAEPRPDGVTKKTSAMCMVHNKQRLTDVLVDDGTGFFECKPEHRCKEAAAPRPQMRGPVRHAAPARKGHGKGPADASTERIMCQLHNKRRTARVLFDDGAGYFSCLPEHQCKGIEEN